MTMLSALRICRLYPRRRHPLHSFPWEADSTPEELNPIRKNPQIFLLFCTSGGPSAPRGLREPHLCATVTNTYRVLVLTVCRLWGAGVARLCRLHVATFLFLDVHVVVWVFKEGSRSRRYLRRQVACSVPLVADSVTQELYLYTRNFIITLNIKAKIFFYVLVYNKAGSIGVT